MTYHNAIKYILSAPDKNGLASSLDRIKLLCERLGSPHNHLKYIRFAGSNGKTVCQLMLSKILVKNGTHVGSLIMPASQEPRENILIDGEPISMADTVKYVSKIAAVVNELREEIAECPPETDGVRNSFGIPEPFVMGKLDITPTKNEIIMLVALMAFKESRCALSLIECEHNGADPTRLLGTPICAVICGTIPPAATKETQKIKSYIKNGLPEIVSAPQDSVTYKIISDACAAINCRLSIPARSALRINRISLTGSEFTYRTNKYTLGVCGRFQIQNAVTVLETVQMLRRSGIDISERAAADGLRAVSMTGRFETISVSPTIIADSTHKIEAVGTMSRSLEDFKEQTGSEITLCLPPDLPLISAYLDSLEEMGYSIKKLIVINSDEEFAKNFSYIQFEISFPKSYKSAATEILNSGSLTLISGMAEDTKLIRREILRILEF